MTLNHSIVRREGMSTHNPVLKGRGSREFMNGATRKEDTFMHLSTDMGHTTICGHMPNSFLLTYADIEITCPDCIKILRERGETDG